MDNVTHSLFGYAMARAAAGPQPDTRLARALTWSAVLASNAPDLDFVVPFFAHNRKLSYLLHHRGYTHTFAVAIVLGAALGLLSARVAGVRGREARAAALVGALAGLLHVVFDFFNNYGVHPFFPFDDHWYYGDAVFIVEPLLLSALLPLCALDARTRAGRTLGWCLCAGLLALSWRALPAPFATANMCFLMSMLAVQARWRLRAWPALVAAMLVVLVFFGGARIADEALRADLARQRPGERLLQLSTTPVPGNPLCWNAIAVSADGSDYRVRFAQQSLLPRLLGPERCAFWPEGQRTARLQSTDLASGPGLLWTHLLSGRSSELRTLARDDCEAAAMLRFVRAPYVQRDGARLLLGDLRYDNEPGLGFAELSLSGGAHGCPSAVPPWVPPLQALLR
jgi:inner membrane protein